ncbi:MAG: hypothetical protein AAF366_20100 [Pseudomonadota bacterium]
MPSGASLSAAIQGYLFGSPAASWLTLAILTFLIAGEAYHRAWTGRTMPDARLTRMGDAISAVGAVFLSFSLASSGSLFLAFVAGLMLAAGKLGTAILPIVPIRQEQAIGIDRTLRWIVVASRIPSLLTLAMGLVALHADGLIFRHGALPGIMIVCFLLWVAADVALMKKSPT